MQRYLEISFKFNPLFGLNSRYYFQNMFICQKPGCGSSGFDLEIGVEDANYYITMIDEDRFQGLG